MTEVHYYASLLAQRERIEAFRRAIRSVVKPGDHVLDIGTGLGTFALFAADAGAGLVSAVEGDPIIHVAQQIATLNGYGDRVRFIRGWLPGVRIERPADVVIFEDFPPRLLDARAAWLLSAVLERLAAEAVRVIPGGATLWAAPVSSADLWREVFPLEHDEAYGLDWSTLRTFAANQAHSLRIPQDALAAAPAALAAVRFDRPVAAGQLAGRACWTFESGREVHGVAYWFELDLGGGERLSNAPGATPASWGQLFLPVDPPLPVAAGGELRVAVAPHAAADGLPGWLAWDVEAGEQCRRGHEFYAAPAALDDLALGSPDAQPELTPAARREAIILALADGRHSVREIAARIAAESAELTAGEAERVVAAVLRGKIRGVGALSGRVTAS